MAGFGSSGGVGSVSWFVRNYSFFFFFFLFLLAPNTVAGIIKRLRSQALSSPCSS